MHVTHNAITFKIKVIYINIHEEHNAITLKIKGIYINFKQKSQKKGRIRATH